jgi:uncharacterized protein YjbK
MSKDQYKKDLYLTIKTYCIKFEGKDGPNAQERFDALIKASLEEKKQ